MILGRTHKREAFRRVPDSLFMIQQATFTAFRRDFYPY